VGLTNLSLLKDVSRHDTHLTSLTDDTRAIPTNHPTDALALKSIHHSNLIPLWDTLSDSDNKLNLSLNGLDNGIGGTCWGYVDD
jgi:hypothetical protein